MFRYISVLFAVFACLSASFAQVGGLGGGRGNEALGKTWAGPSSVAIAKVLRKTRSVPVTTTTRKQPKLTAVSDALKNVVKFTPVGESGVPLILAASFGNGREEVAQLNDGFRQMRQVYEAEAAKDGRSNDLAGAMTYFVAVNVMAFHGSDLPSDADGEKYYQFMRTAIGSAPEFRQLSNADKQKMNDWLVCMAGFVLLTYTDAKNKNDRAGLKTAAELADLSMKVSLGIGAGQVSTANGRLSFN